MMKLYAGLAVAAIAAAVGGTLAYTMLRAPDDQFAQCRSSAVAGGTGDIGGPFTLVNSEGQSVTDADIITGPTLIYFGYTFCPDVCPFDVARNALAVDILEEMGIPVTPVFISIDPERDTPEAVGNFAANMHPNMIGLTGTDEQVKAASQAFKTYYRKQDGDDEFYLVDHSTFTYLMLPGVGFAEFYRRDASPEEMAESIACFVTAS
ncbi:SCO family protein [Palleronia sp. KMU-117]|uniref:SCO family protein n=1 Tax=Palleronia sp. KMU-117 TaxID=3434108 RepID=UPI003D7557DF